jgi:hypothetical protein
VADNQNAVAAKLNYVQEEFRQILLFLKKYEMPSSLIWIFKNPKEQSNNALCKHWLMLFDQRIF